MPRTSTSAASAVDAACAQRHPLLRGSVDYVVRDNEPAFRIESPLLPTTFTSPYIQKDNYAFAGLVDVPIYTGGRVTSEIDAARCNVRAMERRLDRYRLDLKLACGGKLCGRAARRARDGRGAPATNEASPLTRATPSCCMSSNACRAMTCWPSKSRWPTRSTR